MKSLEKFSNFASFSSSRDEPTATFRLDKSAIEHQIMRIVPNFAVPQPSPVTPLSKVAFPV